MNNENKYKEALERAKKLASDLPNGRNDRIYHIWDLESIFPELKESEDEKIISIIRKALEAKVEDLGNGVTRTACLAWLEKQHEQIYNKRHYELEEFAKIIRANLMEISKELQDKLETKYQELTGSRMYGGFID